MHGETGHDLSVLIDAHVHLHDCFSPATFLESARRNFESAAEQHGWPTPIGVLMLTESENADWFGRLTRLADGSAKASPLGPWTITTTDDPNALDVRHGSRRLFIVAGRQVVAREGLEVLTLGSRAMIPDGGSLTDIMAEARGNGALRVIPWGAGKWLFGRGRLLSGILATQSSNDGFFLGDGAGRPFFWSTPNHFAEGERRGIRVLPGTDPLPFPSQESRAGSFGFRLEGPVDLTRPAEGITTALRNPASRLAPFGRLERLLPFLRNQVAMQQRKRLRTTAPQPAPSSTR
ncbi:MAG TPA: hypothetical protein VIG08_14650 [Gemmatimonadales bacterium]